MYCIWYNIRYINYYECIYIYLITSQYEKEWCQLNLIECVVIFNIYLKWFPLVSTFSMLFYAWILNNIDNFVKSPFTIIIIHVIEMLFYAWILKNIDNFVKSPFTIIMIHVIEIAPVV